MSRLVNVKLKWAWGGDAKDQQKEIDSPPV